MTHRHPNPIPIGTYFLWNSELFTYFSKILKKSLTVFVYIHVVTCVSVYSPFEFKFSRLNIAVASDHSSAICWIFWRRKFKSNDKAIIAKSNQILKLKKFNPEKRNFLQV